MTNYGDIFLINKICRNAQESVLRLNNYFLINIRVNRIDTKKLQIKLGIVKSLLYICLDVKHLNKTLRK